MAECGDICCNSLKSKDSN